MNTPFDKLSDVVIVRDETNTRQYFFDCITEAALYPLDPSIAIYLAKLLTQFISMKQPHALQAVNQPKNKWPYVSDIVCKVLLYQTEPIEEVYHPFTDTLPFKEIGDYTLFVSGMFPEFVQKRSTIGFYTNIGSAAYRKHACGRQTISDKRAKVYFTLSANFVSCMRLLQEVRTRWDDDYFLQFLV